MSKWNGVIMPHFTKHRDYAHKDFFTHEMDNGGWYQVYDDKPVMVDRDVVTGEDLVTKKSHHVVVLTLAHEGVYTFLVPSDKNGFRPNRDEVAKSIIEQISHPLPNREKREIANFVADDEPGVWFGNNIPFDDEDLSDRRK